MTEHEPAHKIPGVVADVAGITGVDTEVKGMIDNKEVDLSNTPNSPPITQQTSLKFE